MDRVIAAAPPIVPELFDKDIMDMMVNVRGPRGTSLSDVVALLQHQGISVQEIEAISDRGPRHGGHMIQLKTTAAVEKISLIHRYYFRNKHFTVCPLDKQVVEVRLHWLPLYLGEKFVRSLFTEHGKVLSVERVENTVAQVQVKTGVLRVEVEVTEQQRANIPHLIQFGCGMTTLITMPGRPPLCLRCNRIGHMRRDCQAGTFPSSFAGIVKATPVPVTPEPEESVATQGLQPTPEAQQPAPSGPAPPSQIPTPETETSTPEVEAWPVEEVSRGVKRGEEEIEDVEYDDSFKELFPKQKAKAGRRSERVSTQVIEVENRFSVLESDMEESITEFSSLEGFQTGCVDTITDNLLALQDM